MAIEFIDGFDHYTSAANMGLKWAGTQAAYPGQAGRNGGYSVQVQSSAFIFGTGTFISLPALSTRVVGFAAMLSSDSGHPNSGGAVIFFADSMNIQCFMCFDASTGLLQIRNNNSNALLGTLAGQYQPNVWYYFEIRVVIGTSGSITVRVNSQTQLSLTGVPTQTTANATFTTVAFGSYDNSVWIDDLYVLNTSGLVNNSFLGDCRVATGLPSADSAANAAWTPNAGTSHYTQVHEGNPDGDTTYVSSATVGAIDTYQYPAQSIAATSAVIAVQTVLTARKDDAGSRIVVSECRSGGANHDGVSQFSVGSSYAMYRTILEQDPATGLPWTASGLNGAEFGAKVVA